MRANSEGFDVVLENAYALEICVSEAELSAGNSLLGACPQFFERLLCLDRRKQQQKREHKCISLVHRGHFRRRYS